MLLCALLAGCAAPPLREVAPIAADTPALELEQAPFFPQQMHHCGPAALATVLVASGAEVSPEALADEVYIPGREGSLQAELVAAARRHERMAVRLAPRLQVLLSALTENRPVLILQNLGLERWPRWHYAVLVGWDASRNELILRSGGQRRQHLSLRRFAQTWVQAGQWAVVMADPREPPPWSVSVTDWIAAAAPFESLGRADLAAAAYESAVRRWSGDALAWQAAANGRYARGDLAGAEAALLRAIEIEPAAAALNNLAQVQLERGCPGAALATLQRIGVAPPSLQDAIADTRAVATRRAAASQGAAESCAVAGR